MKVNLVGDRRVGPGEKPYIIAELGSNHNGDMTLAKQLIDAAKQAGADCVKFQSWSKDTIFSRKTYDDNYFLSDDYRDRSDYSLEEIVDDYSISASELREMKSYADEIGIDCISTPFSRPEVDFLVDDLGAGFVKVASMDLNNYPLLRYIAAKGKPILLSTGLSTLAEIDEAVDVIESAGNTQIVILHCVSIYPPEDRQVNLRNMDTLAQAYPYPVGFSDHSLGTCIPVAAIARGACVIEKHFTLDKNMEGWDHRVSATPDEMQTLVEDGHRVFEALGSGRIERVESQERLDAFRRSIVAGRDIAEGEVITEDAIDYKRPGTGLPPRASEFLIGRRARRDIAYDEIIGPDDF